jgi:hypothetical protein
MGELPSGGMGELPSSGMGELPSGGMGELPSGGMGELPSSGMGELPSGALWWEAGAETACAEVSVAGVSDRAPSVLQRSVFRMTATSTAMYVREAPRPDFRSAEGGGTGPRGSTPIGWLLGADRLAAPRRQARASAPTSGAICAVLRPAAGPRTGNKPGIRRAYTAETTIGQEKTGQGASS